MICQYSNKIALECGVNAAFIAGFIWQELNNEYVIKYNNKWVRAGRRKLIAVFPFMHESTAGNALRRLTKAGVILRREINDSPFDRTLSAAFTTYGKSLMESEANYSE